MSDASQALLQRALALSSLNEQINQLILTYLNLKGRTPAVKAVNISLHFSALSRNL